MIPTKPFSWPSKFINGCRTLAQQKQYIYLFPSSPYNIRYMYILNAGLRRIKSWSEGE